MPTWIFYGVLGIGREASKSDIKKAYRELSKKWHPDRWSSKPESERKLAEEKQKEISEAYTVLSDEEKKKYYDQYGDDYWEYRYRENNDGREKKVCSQCRKEFRGRHFKNGISDKIFCSWKCADDHWQERHGKKDKQCRSCGSIHNENTGVPEKCEEILSVISELEDLSHWYFFSSNEKNDFIEEVKSARIIYDPVDFKSNINKTLRRAKVLNATKKETIDREKSQYIQKLKNLDGWGLFNEDKQKEIIEEMGRCRTTDQFRDVLRMVEEEIKKLQGKGPGNEDKKNLQSEIQKAIREIEVKLNQEPKIEWEKNSSFEENWKDYLESSSGLSELKTRKEELLNIIRTARKKQGGDDGLTELRLHAIHLIKRELEKNSISDSELTNPNWENDINQAQSENAIEDIKNQILADIQSKRVVKEKNRLNELLTQAKENWNNYQNLEGILKQIKELRSSNAYQEKEVEIQALENRLQELDPSQYKKTSNELLDQQIKNNGLNDNNMDEETKKEIAEAKRNPTPENRAKAEEKICQNGANNNLSNLITSLRNKLKKGNLTKEEKETAINEIMKFIITENKYQREAYKFKKHEVDALLAELKGEKENQEGVPLTKIIFITALITLPLIIVFILILRVRRRRLRN